MNKYPNNKGLTLLEVTVALGLMMISTLAILQLMKIVDDKMVVTKNKTDLQMFQQNLMPIINDPLTCGCQFKDLKIDLKNKDQIINLEKINYNCSTEPLPFVTIDAKAKSGTIVQAIYVDKIKSTGTEGELYAEVNIKPVNKRQSTILKDASGQIKLYVRADENNPDIVTVVGCGLEPPPCQLPWGGTIEHRQKVIAFKAQEIGNCDINKEERYCEFGTLKGSFSHLSCLSTDCITPWSERITNGTKVTAYVRDLAANCQAELRERTCIKGNLTEYGDFKTCRDPKCKGIDGREMYQGESIKAYKSDMSDNCEANSETRTCNDGVLSGAYTRLSCVPDHCKLPWGEIIADNASVVGYDTDIADFCEERKMTSICKRGQLTGGAMFKNCESIGCKAPWGELVKHNSFVTAYRSDKSDNCKDPNLSERRSCSRGTLSGSFTHKECKELTCISPNGRPMKDGDSIEAYRESESISCQKELRTCREGVLTGSYQNTSCRVITCPSPFGKSLLHGENIVAYKESSALFCTSEIRSCNYGSLSGSYTHKTCTTLPNRR